MENLIEKGEIHQSLFDLNIYITKICVIKLFAEFTTYYIG